MRAAWLLVFTLGCAARIGNQPNPTTFCQTAGWFVTGPRSVALHREVTFRVKKCATDVALNRFTWSVSDGSVIKIVSSSNDHARIKGMQYGMADLVVVGTSGQFVLSVTVE